MRKTLSLLLVLSLLTALTAAWAEETEGNPALSIEPVTEEIRPGKAMTVAFTVPEAGPVHLCLTDGAGGTVCEIVEEYAAQAGRNEVTWNGTCDSTFAPMGSWRLQLTAGGASASTPVTVGPAAPYLTNIMSSVDINGEAMTVHFYASVSGLLSVGAVMDGAWTLLDSVNIQEGENAYVWQPSGSPENISALTLTLTDVSGFPSTEEHVPVYAADFGFEIAPAMGELELPAIVDGLPESVDLGGAPAAAEAPAVYTPAHGSPYEGQDTSLNYWTMPMDITDEETVWNVLMQPMTILYSSRDRAERTQAVLREQPDEDSRGVGVVTRMNQGVHVLETLDNGWSLIECYSSSFFDSAVKAWNMLVQGYVKTDELRTVEPQKDYGIVIDKLTQRLYLFKEGHLFSTLLVSTGLSNEKQPYNETRSGEFVLTSAVGAFKDGNLTFEMAIRFNSGDLLHEIPHYTNADGSRRYGYGLDELGTKASHGCIRVQRYRTPEGVNMSWLWNNRVKNTKLLIWEDWQGRQIPYPDDALPLYYNPNKGEMYHSQETCYSAVDKVFTPFTYGELDQEPYASLTRCPYCTPPLRKSEIDERNAAYAPGGDHDPILTEARQKYLDGLE